MSYAVLQSIGVILLLVGLLLSFTVFSEIMKDYQIKERAAFSIVLIFMGIVVEFILLFAKQ